VSAVQVDHSGATTLVTLNRPDRLNAFNEDLVSDLMKAVQTATSDGTRLMVIRGSGKGFSGGFDLSDLDDVSDRDLVARFIAVEELLQAVCHASFATLALVHGPCYGAAADLVAVCDWRIATPDARFRMPGSRFGLVLGTGRLARLVGADTARKLLFREKPFGAEEALSSGFVTEVSDQTGWSEREASILAQATSVDRETYAAMKARMLTDDPGGDMAALKHSTSEGSVKARIQAYVAGMKAAKTK